MPVLLALAFGAGVLTILSPCTLPLVPLVVGAGGSGRSGRLAGVLIGFAGTFLLTTVLLASALAAAGFTTSAVRLAAAVVIGLFGATLVIPALAARFEARTAGVAGLGAGLAGRVGRGPSFLAGIGLGAAIGLVWAPCVGPIMAGVLATAVAAGPTADGVAIALAYVLGAAVPLAAIAIGGRRVVGRFGGAAGRARLVRATGLGMVAVSLLVVTGLDVPLQTTLADALPAGFSTATTVVGPNPSPRIAVTTETSQPAASPASAEALPAPVASSLPASVALEDLGAAPALTGITGWINSDPLTLASLRGKVVLVHFWTFGCINCIHVQPYVKAWYARYEAAGFVVIGVHTPELSFERDFGNVQEAVAKNGVRFPVAFDPAFATWNAYSNSYWPAFYFVDRTGTIRHVHFGEGDYDGSEQVIRELLAEPG